MPRPTKFERRVTRPLETSDGRNPQAAMQIIPRRNTNIGSLSGCEPWRTRTGEKDTAARVTAHGRSSRQFPVGLNDATINRQSRTYNARFKYAPLSGLEPTAR